MRRRFLLLGFAGALLFLGGCGERLQPQAPQALFALRPSEGTAPLHVVCDGSLSFSDSARIVEYVWDFGDGSRGLGPIVSHTYERGGTYRVTLAVYDERGLVGRREAEVVVEFPTPEPAFTFAPPRPGTYETIHFDASGSRSPNGDIVTYRWAFGDGTSGEGVTVEHSYEYGGGYLVTLSVVDEAGQVATVNQVITVEGGPSCGR